MASPFAVFRRNQKIMLAVVGIGAMIAFVFLDPLMRYLGQSQGPQNPVVVETKYGDLKESDIANIRQSRELVEAFLMRATTETIDAQIQGGQLDGRMRDPILQNYFGFWKGRLMERSKPSNTEAAAVETLILSKKAEQLGMVVSDRAINDMLEQLTADSLTSDSLQTIVTTLDPGRRISATRLFDAIRTEMLASKFAQLFELSLSDIPPAQKFEYFLRLNRRAKAEIVPLAVVDFTSQVANPSDAALQPFFEKYKNQLPDPTSPEPGFKEPQRAAFQYFKADFAKFKEELKPKVTDEEIAAYYEKNKTQFQAFDLPKGPDEKPKDESKPDAAAPDESAKPEESKPDESKPEAAKPESDKPAEEAKPEAPPTEQPKAEKPPEGDAPKQSQSSAVRGVPVRLVSTAGAAEEPAADKAPAAVEPAAAATDAPAEKAEEKAAEKPADAPAEKPAAPDAAAKPEEKPAEPRYEPLDKVKDQIRDSIAGQKGAEKIAEIFGELSGQMRRYADELDIYSTRKESDAGLKPPKPFNFAELAKTHGVEAKELPLVTAAEAATEDIGKVYRVIRDPRSQLGFRTEPFVQFAYSESLPTYKANAVEDTEGNGYLFWKTQEVAAFVPKFDKVREKVLTAWKMIEARPLARKRAQELAVQARASGKPLKDVFADQASLKTIEAGSFTWMTTGNVPRGPSGAPARISQVEGVENVGPAFMKEVFSLPAGGIGVAANHPEDTVYVVQLVEYEQPIDQLRDEFAKERPDQYIAMPTADQRQMYAAWIDNLEKDANIHWIRQPDVGRPRETIYADYEGPL